MSEVIEASTPWRRVFTRFGVSQNQFAQAIGAHRSKVSRALADDRGLINGTDQEKIMQAAKMRGVTIPAEDFLPSV